jgi:hypothetical protein
MNLKDDIDAPIRTSIAALNLLGIKTAWSCCGYDYPDQPPDKGHFYGQFQLNMKVSPKAEQVCLYLIKNCPGLSIRYNPFQAGCKDIISVTVNFKDCNIPPNWHDPKSQHHHEMGSMYATNIENALLRIPRGEFLNNVAVIDANAEAKEAFKHWAHPIAEPWIIDIKDIFP